MELQRTGPGLTGTQELELSEQGKAVRDEQPARDATGPMTFTTRDGEVVHFDPDTFTPNDTRERDFNRNERRERIDKQRTMQNLANLADRLGSRYRGEQALINPTTGMPAVDAIRDFFAPIMGHSPKFSRGALYEEIDRAMAFPAMEFARNVDIGRSKRDVLRDAARMGKNVDQVEQDFDRVVSNMRRSIDRGLDPRQALSDAINETGLFGGVGRMGSHSSSDNDAQGTGDLSSFGYYGIDDPRNTYGVEPGAGAALPDDQIGPHRPAARPADMPSHIPAQRPGVTPDAPLQGPVEPAYGPHQPAVVSLPGGNAASTAPVSEQLSLGGRAWSGLGNFASNLFGALKTGFSRLAAAGNSHEVYGTVLENRDLAMFGRPGQTLQSFREERAARNERLSDTLSSAWGGIKEAADSAWGGITEAASDAWGGISDAAGDAWGGIKDAAADAWGGFKDAVGLGDKRDDDGTSADDAKERSERNERDDPEPAGADRDGPGGKAV